MFRGVVKPIAATFGTTVFIGTIATLVLGLCGLWIPDIISHQENTLLTAESKGGYKLKIIQAWGSDFYRTSGKLFMPDGQVKEFLIEPDSLKWWNCQCKAVIDEGRKKINFGQHPGRKVVVYEWNTGETWFVNPPISGVSTQSKAEEEKNYLELQKALYGSNNAPDNFRQ
jgi:hypothetical protein